MSYFKAIGRPVAAFRGACPEGYRLNYASSVSIAVQAGLSVKSLSHSWVNTNGTLYANVGALNQTIVTVPNNSYSLSLDKRCWSFVKPPLAFVSHETSSELAEAEQVIVGAAGGIYQVDVPEGGRFTVEPSCLVAYTGQKPSIFETDTRFDAAYALAAKVSESVKRATLGLVSRSKRLPALISNVSSYIQRFTSSKTKTLPAAETEIKKAESIAAPSAAQALEPVKRALSTVSSYTSRGYQFANSKFQHWARRRQLVFEGPCTVLVQGASRN